MRVCAALWWLCAPGSALAATATCDDGEVHPTLAGALARPDCETIRVAGVHFGQVVVDRDVTLIGDGTDLTFQICRQGPCVDVAPGVHLEIVAMTIASRHAALVAESARVDLAEVALRSVGHDGGWLRLRDTDATLTDCALEVTSRQWPVIDAVSRGGSDLELLDVRFLGATSPSAIARSVYTANVGVVCTACTSGPRLPPLRYRWLEGLAPEDAPVAVASQGAVTTAPWAQLSCAEPGPEDRAACDAQCGARVAATCTMQWTAPDSGCAAIARCVDAHEIPTW